MRRRLALTDLDTGEIIETKVFTPSRFKSRPKRTRRSTRLSNHHVTFIALVIALTACIAR